MAPQSLTLPSPCPHPAIVHERQHQQRGPDLPRNPEPGEHARQQRREKLQRCVGQRAEGKPVFGRGCMGEVVVSARLGRTGEAATARGIACCRDCDGFQHSAPKFHVIAFESASGDITVISSKYRDSAVASAPVAYPQPSNPKTVEWIATVNSAASALLRSTSIGPARCCS